MEVLSLNTSHCCNDINSAHLEGDQETLHHWFLHPCGPPHMGSGHKCRLSSEQTPIQLSLSEIRLSLNKTEKRFWWQVEVSPVSLYFNL